MNFELGSLNLDRRSRRKVEGKCSTLQNDSERVLVDDLYLRRLADFHTAVRHSEDATTGFCSPDRVAFEHRRVIGQLLTGTLDFALKNNVADNSRFGMSCSCSAYQ